jgi:hypothetical protein
MGENGPITSVGDSINIGRLRKELGQYQSGDEMHWSPRIHLTRGIFQLA